jgi:xanthine dehydrogenase accessory factor
MVARLLRQVVIVIGSDETGSAVAVHLQRGGFAVVVCDTVDPCGLRRGMAFTDAWYVGNADLDGVSAVFCSSVKSIPAVLEGRQLVAATTWSWAGAAAALRPFAVVDARMRDPGDGADLRTRAPKRCLTMGIGPGFVAGEQVDVAVPAAASGGGDARAAALRAPELADDALEDAPADDDGKVRAARAGRFATSRRIGERVAAGEIVGWLGHSAVHAPRAGALRGLVASGARNPAACFGIDAPAARIARAVLEGLAARAPAEPGVTEMQSTPDTMSATTA